MLEHDDPPPMPYEQLLDNFIETCRDYEKELNERLQMQARYNKFRHLATVHLREKLILKRELEYAHAELNVQKGAVTQLEHDVKRLQQTARELTEEINLKNDALEALNHFAGGQHG